MLVSFHHVVRKRNTFSSLFSSLAFENIWACWRRRKITNSGLSEFGLSGRGAAKKASSLPALQLNRPSVQQGDDFLPLIKWPKAWQPVRFLSVTLNFCLCLAERYLFNCSCIVRVFFFFFLIVLPQIIFS